MGIWVSKLQEMLPAETWFITEAKAGCFELWDRVEVNSVIKAIHIYLSSKQ